MLLAFSGIFQPEPKQIYLKDLKNKREQKEKRYLLPFPNKSKDTPFAQTAVSKRFLFIMNFSYFLFF